MFSFLLLLLPLIPFPKHHQQLSRRPWIGSPVLGFAANCLLTMWVSVFAFVDGLLSIGSMVGSLFSISETTLALFRYVYIFRKYVCVCTVDRGTIPSHFMGLLLILCIHFLVLAPVFDGFEVKFQVTTLPDDFPDAHSLINDLRLEYVIAVEGVVRSRPSESINKKMKTGLIEVLFYSI